MRRLMIFVMIGIITFSTFTTFPPTLPEKDSYRLLLDTVYGSVTAGNFSYWTFGTRGPLVIELTSLTGDADIFVGDTLRPSYEPDKHNFSSETCGIDSVFIPADFPRPLVIAVYGHWPHNKSQFSMKVFTDLDTIMGNRLIWDPPEDKTPSPPVRMVETSRSSPKDKTPFRTEIVPRDEDKPRFLKFYRVLDTMFGLLV